MAFLFVDLNHFKEINDSFGHPAGDELLRQLGPRLTQAARSHNVVLRLGGDEFGVVLVGADADEATEVAERIAAELEEPFEIHEMKVRVGVSIGIALVPDRRDRRALGSCGAPTSRCTAPSSATSPYAFYDQDVDGGEHHMLLVDELREAIEQGAPRRCTTSRSSTCAPAGSSPSRRCFAGRTPGSASSRR